MTDHRREEVEDEEDSICHQVALEEKRETVGNGNTRPTAKQLEKKNNHTIINLAGVHTSRM